MKLAISGKGGVGKSTIAAALALLFVQKGHKVLALDADPDANLASALGIPGAQQKSIVPMSRQISLIEERTGANVRRYSQMFKLNPKVDDIASQFAFSHKGVSLLVLGTVPAGGNGCACPYNTFVRALVADLVLFKNETLIMDMEAGIEHLGRATSSGVDLMAIVVEPGQRSIDSALTISRMAGEIGLRKTVLIGNKATDMADEQFIRHAFPDREVLIVLPYSEELRRSDRDGVSVLDSARGELAKRMRKLSEEMERLSK